MQKIKMLSSVVIDDGQGIGKVGEIYEVERPIARILVGQGAAEFIDGAEQAEPAPAPNAEEPMQKIKMLTDAVLGDGRGIGKVGEIYEVKRSAGQVLVGSGSAELVRPS